MADVTVDERNDAIDIENENDNEKKEEYEDPSGNCDNANERDTDNEATESGDELETDAAAAAVSVSPSNKVRNVGIQTVSIISILTDSFFINEQYISAARNCSSADKVTNKAGN